jgi:hypothetical protein
MDREVLKQVVAYLDGELVDLPVEDTDVVLLAAARAVVEAPEVWWCKTHDEGCHSPITCRTGVFRMESCRMVVVYLVPKEQT